MSKSEMKSLGPTINITRSIKRELKKNLDALKELLKDDPEFAKLLVEKTLLLGNGVYTNEIKDLIFKQYAHYFYNDNGYDSRGSELLKVTYELGKLMGGDIITRKKTFKLPEEEQEQYFDKLHNEIEQEVYKIYFSSENSESDIIGESNNFDV